MLLNIAIKNLLGARLRSFLNIFVTSLSFFIIIFISGMYDGMRQHAKHITIKTEISGGAYWHPNYDPLDPMSYEKSHSVIPSKINILIEKNKAVPILVSQATIYPNGRMIPVIMKGILPSQSILDIPVNKFIGHEEIHIPIVIGRGMAENAKLEVGDSFILRWLDSDKTYDANEATIVHIMDTENFKIDIGHIWLPLNSMRKMLAMENEASYVVFDTGIPIINEKEDWIHRDVNYLIQDIEAAIEADQPANIILFIILLALAAMGIFNAQVLSIFRRGKEIGTLIALGMTRSQVITLFTLEGTLVAFFAALMTIILFGPLLWWFSIYGIPLPIDYSEMGLIIAKRLIPIYSFKLIFNTTLLISIIVLIVSYIPSRKIAIMNPTDALRGKTIL
ncbi:MAG: ABC transporter permease [Candidatus Marinimicrobia bacterium]|nr:ABC transporter permease [Candidatus Neomarinimicrobiota bacterium]|tara:strand:- start:1627 stop:2802 length:1176 start_codon:yes stop_codon:yes gene_type:complete